MEYPNAYMYLKKELESMKAVVYMSHIVCCVDCVLSELSDPCIGINTSYGTLLTEVIPQVHVTYEIVELASEAPMAELAIFISYLTSVCVE